MKVELNSTRKDGMIFYYFEIAAENDIENLILTALRQQGKDNVSVDILGVGTFYQFGSAHLFTTPVKTQDTYEVVSNM